MNVQMDTMISECCQGNQCCCCRDMLSGPSVFSGVAMALVDQPGEALLPSGGWGSCSSLKELCVIRMSPYKWVWRTGLCVLEPSRKSPGCREPCLRGTEGCDPGTDKEYSSDERFWWTLRTWATQLFLFTSTITLLMTIKCVTWVNKNFPITTFI